ncbi:hypothetical protein [Leeuwenhoekiella parthenopeia]|uniref:Lipoprotein n=1 Tax=Leeuwenhoekiella parthenopeia TaxID=2890320 RepID=A0ABS8GYS5_9FLAO|nr:hypothetical protein [Leeuwenhoekiella parthenopeia]MCC4213728.1 hypothetical protein [Leeuwenhoekiella parthenopeia]
MTKALILIFLVLLIGCDHRLNSTSIEEAAIFESNAIVGIETLGRPEIIGIWYSSFLNLNESLTLLEDSESIEGSILYEFQFKENGNLIFTDLTESYVCGLGILEINKGTWKMHHDNFLTVFIEGEITGECSFEKELQYEIIPSKKGVLHLRLDNVNRNCEIGYGGTAFVD